MMIPDKVIQAFDGSEIEYRLNEPLSKHTTFRIGGNADIFVMPKSVDDLICTVEHLKRSGIKYTVIGNASNVLFSDNGYAGAVISTKSCNKTEVSETSVKACCGASFTHLAAVARDNSLTGLEFAYGIPGTVGGAVFMNAGAYGGEVSACLSYCTAYDTKAGKRIRLSKEKCLFGYRHSIFADDQDLLVLEAEFSLKRGNKDKIGADMELLMKKRRDSQPLDYPSAGSVFKRPSVGFAGKYIEDCGLKGYTVGGASVSEKHAGFIINSNGAGADDVRTLIDIVQKTVYERYGIMLECEIRMI